MSAAMRARPSSRARGRPTAESVAQRRVHCGHVKFLVPYHSIPRAKLCRVAAELPRGRCGVAAEGRPLLVLQLASGASYP